MGSQVRLHSLTDGPLTKLTNVLQVSTKDADPSAGERER